MRISRPQEHSLLANQSTEAAAAIDEAAAIWLLRLEASASPELQQDLQKWLDEEPRHRAAFIRLRFAWYTSDKFRLLRPADGRVDEDLITKL
ncbi:MAG: FecR/PupR family sigma factor regulator [Steroidobacteraceae bacterium]